jgi:hypothetical protein
MVMAEDDNSMAYKEKTAPSTDALVANLRI